MYKISSINWQESIVSPTVTIDQASQIMKKSTMGFAVVLDDQKKLLGIVTQNDFRKGLLRRVDCNSPVTEIMNPNPQTALSTDDQHTLKSFFVRTSLMHLPIVNQNGELIRVEYCNEHIKIAEKDNWVVIMAGGLGKRLRPLTESIPKPLLKLGTKPILETIIENCVKCGFKKFFISVNYRSDMIKENIGSGSRWGIEIQYLEEKNKMGTAGALSLLPGIPPKTILVMNGDLLTDLNYQELLNFHLEQKVSATMGVKEYEFLVPFGVVKVQGNHIMEIDEKPVHKFFINAGIYLLEPEVIRLIPEDQYLDMPDLFRMLGNNKKLTSVFPIHEYWLDIGRIEDYKKANGDFKKIANEQE